MTRRNVRHDDTVLQSLSEMRFKSESQILDKPSPWLLRTTIRLLSSNVRIGPDAEERIRNAAKTGPVVYAMKFRSVYDLHFLRMRFAELGLPLPAFAFGFPFWGTGSLAKVISLLKSGFARLRPGSGGTGASEETMLKEVLQAGGAGVLVLADESTFRARYLDPDKDPLRVVLDIQGSMAGSISVVPLTVLYDRAPRRLVPPFWETLLGNPERPGPLRRVLVACLSWSQPELIVGRPIAVVEMFEEFGGEELWEDLPFKLRRDLIESVNAPIRVIRGPEKLSRTEIKELVLQDQRVQQAIARIKTKENRPEWKVRQTAEAYVDEIAADQQIHVIHFLYHLLKRVFHHVFDGVDLKEAQFDKLREEGEQGSLVVMPCHKSHFDYLVVLFLLFVNRVMVPLTAAGKNLSFWPVGPVMRRGAAFFIRRSFKGIPLYTRVFSAYCKVLIREKYNLAFFIEGGRSRTGKLLQPRLGMLTFLLQAVEEGAAEDLLFVPLFVGYERIPEEGSYLKEMTGGKKKAESFAQILSARKILKRRHGKVYVRVHPAVSYRSFCRQITGGIEPENLSAQQRRQVVSDFAYRIESGILDSGVITAVDLASSALVSAGRNPVNHTRLMDVVSALSDAFRNRGIEFAENLTDMDSALRVALAVFSERGFIVFEHESETSPDGTVYRIEESKIQHVRFYRNAVVNYLWPHAFVAALLLGGEKRSGEPMEGLEAPFTELKTLFRTELIYDPLKVDSELLEDACRFFSQQGWITPVEGGKFTIKDRDRLSYFRDVMIDLFELYYFSVEVSETIHEPVSQKQFSTLVEKLVKESPWDENAGPKGAFPSVSVRDALNRLNDLGIVDLARSKKVVRSGKNSVDRATLRQLLKNVLGL